MTYSVRKALPGIYKVQVKLYSKANMSITNPVVVKVVVVKKWGSDEEQEECIVVRLEEAKQVIDVTSVFVE